MTIARAIIKQALRESNLIALAADPNDNQNTEGLGKLNSIIAGVFGFKAGVQLREWPVGTDGVSDVSVNWNRNDWAVPPPNVRLMVSSTDPETIVLPSFPDNGARVGLVDLTGSMSAHNVTLDPNGKRIEDATSVTVAIDSANLEWMYRADLGNWQRLTLLGLDDEMPFPIQFDTYFETVLAMRLNPRYGRATAAETGSFLSDSLAQLRATYRQRRNVRAPEEVLRLSDTGRGGVVDDDGTTDRKDLWLS